MSAIIIDDKIVHYEVLGRGKPVIFLHGWVGSWRYWIPTMQSISVSYRAYAIDLWGFGDSAKVESKYTLDSQLALLDYFLNEMAIAKVALVGHGLGAVVAAIYASQHPFVVDRYMAVGLPINHTDLHERMFNDPTSVLADWLLANTPASDAARAEAPKADDKAVRNSLDELKFINVLSISKLMQTPALLVHGDSDPAIKTPQDLYEENIIPPNTHQIVFGESGHFPMLDQPNKFNRLVNDFLELSSGESPRQLQLKEEWKRRVR
jgi:pimeloyl-ACP methyl ester carboxylesterase